ncbi:MAG: hypothetical protein IPI67_09555 [Myxococcales bacterium]|nr:hypothetical protein [Myxococcales bacterium]
MSSNVRREDYAGSRICGKCHGDIARKWTNSPMHRMTRAVAGARVDAPFDGRPFRFMGDTATPEMLRGARFVRLDSAREGKTLYRVTKVIGGRYREDYAGVRVDEKDPGAAAGGDDRILPITWLRFSNEWRYKGYSVMNPERNGLVTGPVWRTTCIFCHNTVPSLVTMYDELHGPGGPKYQGSASFVLPSTLMPRFRITDPHRLGTAIRGEVELLGGEISASEPQALLAEAMQATRRSFGEAQLVETGIGCEACHGGSREHAESPTHVRTSFAVRSDFMQVTAPDGRRPSRASDMNRACAKCHTVLFSGYRYTWEGGERFEHPGGSNVNSGEARDFMLGHCSNELSCASCHDPHAEDPRARLEELTGPKGQALCTSCHRKYSSPLELERHTHHLASGPGSACVACHMPRKNMGLAYALTRYHRIGSPTDPERVLRDRPMECALCHPTKTTEFLVSTAETWYKKRFDRRRLRGLYGADFTGPAWLATLRHGKPHEQATAIGMLGEQRVAAALPDLVEQLDNSIVLVRFFARGAIEQISGEKLELDMGRPGPELVAAGRAWLERRSGPPSKAVSE